MIKRLMALLLAAAIMLCMTACGSKVQTEEPAEEPEQTEELEETEDVSEPEEEPLTSRDLEAGWIITDSTAAVLPDDVQAAFDKASEGFAGSGLFPVAYFGRQVVSGMNYAVLCRAVSATAEPITTLKVAIIYVDLDGNAAMTYLNDFWLVDYTGGEEGDIQTYEEDLAGGWEIPEDYTKADLTDEQKSAFKKASEGLMGNDLTPMACLGTQNADGTNYAFLCRSELTTADPVKSIQVATVYVDTDGNAYVTNIATVNAADFNK